MALIPRAGIPEQEKRAEEPWPSGAAGAGEDLQPRGRLRLHSDS